jgi:hypothetical protein
MKLSEISNCKYFVTEKSIDCMLKNYLNLPVIKLQDIPRANHYGKFEWLYETIVKDGKIPESSCETMTLSEFMTMLKYGQDIEYLSDSEHKWHECVLYDSRMLMQLIRENHDIVSDLYKSINIKAFLEFYRSKVDKEDKEEQKLLSFVYGKNSYEEKTIGDTMKILDRIAHSSWMPMIDSYKDYINKILQTYELMEWLVRRSLMQMYPSMFNEQEVLKKFGAI